MIGEVLSRYRIEQPLGEGGMGVVYRAHDLRLGRPVALKLLKRQLHAIPAAWGQLLAEAQTASALNHPNICTVYEVGEEEGQAYISMEYVEGEPLNRALPPGGLSAGLVARYGLQIAEAVEHAHARGVIHRDIKSANIMITPEGRVKVLDFGLAQRLPPEELAKATTSHASLKELGPIAGTLPYLAPELLRGKPATVRTDLWALGVVLHEMATGQLPFKGDTAFELSMAIMVDSKVALPPRVPSGLRPIVEHCLEKDPARRYQRAHEVAEDLQKQGVSSGVAPFSLPLPRRGVLLAAGALLLAALLALAIPSVRHRLHLPPSAAATPPAGVPALSQGKFVALVPFRVLGDPASLNYMAEGLTDALSAKLFQLRALRVIPTPAVESATRKKSVDQVAGELGINLAVTGVVQGAGDQVRVVVALQDFADRKQLWTQEFSGSRKQLLAMEDQIFLGLVSALRVRPSSEEITSLSVLPTENADAYDLYLRGRDAIRNYKDADDISTAINFYEQALTKDPHFALAYAGMADASLEMYGQRTQTFWAEKALHAAQEAARLNPRLAEAHFALGSVYYSTGHPDRAVAELKRALELEPNSDEGYRRLGSAYLTAGQKDQAITAYQKAIQLSPYYPDNYQMLGDAYLDMGQNEKALSAYRRVTELEPDDAAGYQGLGAVHFKQGKWTEAVSEFQKALELHPDWDTYSDLGLADFYLKRYDEAVSMFEKAADLNPDEEIAAGNLADAYRWSGKKDKAAATYDRAIALANKKLQVNPRDTTAMGSLALYYAKKGNTPRAIAFIRRARHLAPDNVDLIYIDAVVRALAGRSQDALQSLRQAFLKGYSPRQAANDPELGSLQGLPQFAKLTQEFAGSSD